MLSSVLNSERAVQMNIVIMRAFVRLRQALASNRVLAAKIEKLEAAQIEKLEAAQIEKLEAAQKDHSSILSVVIKDIEGIAKHMAKEFERITAPQRRRKPRIGFYPGAK